MSAWGLDKSRRIGFIINDGISAGTNYLDSITDGVLRYGGSALFDTSTAASTYAALSGGNTFTGNQTMNNDILFSTGTTHYLRQINATSTNEMFSVGFAGKPISTYRYSSLGKYGWYIDATEKAFVFENTAVDFDELGYRFNGGAAITGHVFEGSSDITSTNKTISPAAVVDISDSRYARLAAPTNTFEGNIKLGANSNPRSIHHTAALLTNTLYMAPYTYGSMYLKTEYNGYNFGLTWNPLAGGFGYPTLDISDAALVFDERGYIIGGNAVTGHVASGSADISSTNKTISPSAVKAIVDAYGGSGGGGGFPITLDEWYDMELQDPSAAPHRAWADGGGNTVYARVLGETNTWNLSFDFRVVTGAVVVVTSPLVWEAESNETASVICNIKHAYDDTVQASVTNTTGALPTLATATQGEETIINSWTNTIGTGYYRFEFDKGDSVVAYGELGFIGAPTITVTEP